VSAFDKFPRASFLGIEFPYEERTIHLGIREHQHKYPHTAGAALETLGRELYEIDWKCSFQDTFKKYPDLYPSGLARLRRAVEQETRGPLVVPGLGTIQAVCLRLTQTATPKTSVSGEKVDMSFCEDIEDAFLVNNLIGVSNQSLNASVEAFQLQADKVPGVSIFDQILSVSNSLLGIVDTAQSYGNLLEAKILAAAGLCQRADATLAILNDPLNHELLEAMHQLWDSLNKLNADLMKTGGGLVKFNLQRTMSAVEISQSLYAGDGTHAVELMQLNPWPDPFAVPAGTPVRYYRAAA
jgi:prophage DNA circulation protein